MTQRSVRELRVALAAALVEQSDGAAELRGEALSLLDRALKEPGTTPSDAEIHRLAGAILERSNPAAAFTHYFHSAAADIDEESARRACALLDGGDQTVMLSALEETTQHWATAYRNTDVWNVWVALLAVALLRLSGQFADALAVLERTPMDGELHLRVAGPRMVELLLLVGRVDDACGMLDRIEGADSAELRIARARCAFWSRDFERALAELDPDDGSSPSVEASVLQSMSLIGLDRAGEALLLLSSTSESSRPDILRTQGVAHLHQRDYTAAQEKLWSAFSAEPTSVESLLLTTQLGLEGLGDPFHTFRPEEISPSPDEGDVLAQARRPLHRLVGELTGVTSRWLVMQDVARADDDRYRYFRCELLRETREAAGRHLTTADLSDTEGLWSTTSLQDGILAELRGDALARQGRRSAAAAAYDEASTGYGDARLFERALRCASEALRLESNLARSAKAALYAYDQSYELESDPEQVWPLVDTAQSRLERCIVERARSDPAFSEAARSLAWLRLRRAELVVEKPLTVRSHAIMTALLAAVLNRLDADLLVETSAVLGDNDLPKTAVLVSAAAVELTPNNASVVMQAVAASANDVPDMTAVDERLRDLDSEPDPTWLDAMRLHVALVRGDRPALDFLRSRPVHNSIWARLDNLYANALVDGVMAETREQLSEILETTGLLTSVEIACVLADRSSAQAALEDDERVRNEAPEDVESARALVVYAFDPAVSEEDFLRRVLPLCWSRSQVGWVGNVILPLLATARGTIVDDSSKARITTLLADRGRELDGVTWQDELGRRDPLLLAATRIWAGRDGRIDVDTMNEGAADLQKKRLDEATVLVAAEAEQIAFDEAGKHLALRLADAVASGSTPSSDLARQAASDAWSPVLRAALAFLAGDGDAAARAAMPDLEGGLRVVQSALEGAATDAGRWWRLDDYMESRVNAAEDPSLVERLRDSMLPKLADVVGLTSISYRPTRNPLAFLLGTDLVPRELTTDWDVLTTLVPAMRERIKAVTGIACPWVSVGVDPLFRDSLRVLIHENPFAHFRLPTTGHIVQGGPPDHLRDLLSGQPVTVVEDDASNAELPSWTPIEFAVRQVEAIVLAHLDVVIQVTDMADALADVDRRLADRVLSDASAAIRCLDLFRANAPDGSLREPTTIRQLAEKALRGFEMGGLNRG